MSVYVVKTALSSVLCSLTFDQQKYSNIDDGERCNKIDGASCNTHVFFRFFRKRS